MTTDRIESILHLVSKRIQELIPSERFYVLFYNSNRGGLSFPLVLKDGAILPKAQTPWLERTILSENTLPDWLISSGNHLLIERDLSSHLEQNKLKYWPPGDEIPQSWMGVSMMINGQVAGALVVENWRTTGSLNKNNLRVLDTVARQTATAIENARLYEQLERKVASLKILNGVGQQLTKGLAREEKEILELLHASLIRLELDISNMYIAFYDADSADTKDEIRGSLKFVMAFDEGKSISIPDRRAGKGLTEYVIRKKASFNPQDVNRAYHEIAVDFIHKIPRSWLGVPMISDGSVFGVIVLRNNDFERAYTQDDQEILETLASQAAVSLQIRREQRKQIEMERVFAMGSMAAEFAHKMNNIAGTIPIRVNMARDQLDLSKPKDQEIDRQLTKIEAEVNNLLQAAQEVRNDIELGEDRIPEEIQINELIETAVMRAQSTRINMEVQVEPKVSLEKDLPLIKADRGVLLETLTNIIKNGFEAIEKQGLVEVTTQSVAREEKTLIQIEVRDNGKGIPSSQLSKIFDLFHTTKGEKGLGFGLWRDKVFIKKLGGEIDVDSEENHGSTFTIRIPVN